jgi:pimeloyl-ACP methyl ester carboxylesterase
MYSPQVIIHLNIVNAMLSVDFSKYSSRVEIDDELEKTIKDISIRQFIMKNVHRNSDGTFCWKLNIDAISKALPEIMNSIHLEKYISDNGLSDFPVLFIRGGKSGYILPHDYAEIKRNFPNAKIETIPNAGHWVHAEQPVKFMQLVTEFMDN